MAIVSTCYRINIGLAEHGIRVECGSLRCGKITFHAFLRDAYKILKRTEDFFNFMAIAELWQSKIMARKDLGCEIKTLCVI
jgi:hypothetical protein